MAKTGNNSSTSDDDWLLLYDILALVTEHTKKETVAAQLLLDYFAETGRPTRYWYQPVDHAAPDRGIHPSSWRGHTETRRWGFHIVVDWENSSVAQFRVAPDPDDVKPETHLELLGHLREFLPVEPIYRIHLVRLQRRVAFDALRWAGLLPPLPIPAAADAARQSSAASAPVADAGVIAPSEPPSATEPIASASIQRSNPSAIIPVEPKALFDILREQNPRKPGERVSKYASRLHGLIETAHDAGEVSQLWNESTVRRALYRRG